MIPFGPFQPSRSQFNPGASPMMLNCRPVADGWGPMPSLSAHGSPLPGPVRGAVVGRDNAGNATQFAGTASRLYRFDRAALAWVDVSGPSAPYAVPEGDHWSFVQYGERLIAATIGSPPQVFDLSLSTAFSDLGGNPPRAKYVWIAGDFVVLGHHVGFATRVQWSGLNDAEHWIAGQKGSDIQFLPDGGAVQGGIATGNGAFVIQRSAIRAMQFAPETGYTFTFRTLNPRRGAISAASIVQIGPQDFAYLCEDGFFRGAEGVPIGAEAVDRWFLTDEADLDQLALVQGVYDPFEKIVWWRYGKPDGTHGLIGYDWHLGRWCAADAGLSYLLGAVTPGLTWDSLDTLNPSIDAVDEPFESRLFKGGQPNFAGFDADHIFGYLSGPNLPARLQTAMVELASGRRAFCNGFRVVTDASDLTGAASVRDSHGGATRTRPPASPSGITGLVPARANGRLHRFEIAIPAGAEWSHAHGVEPAVKGGGRR